MLTIFPKTDTRKIFRMEIVRIMEYVNSHHVNSADNDITLLQKFRQKNIM